MTVVMNNSSAPLSRAQRLFEKNIELENCLRKSAQSRVPSDPNAWLQMRENYEAIVLEDHDFSEKNEIEYVLWQLHYKRIEEFRAHINSAVSAGSHPSQRSPNRPDRIKKIRSVFKSFLSEVTGFYHDMILKIRAKYGLPLDYFSESPESQIILMKDEKKSVEMKKGLMSCHRCLIFLGDLARYKGLYGEGDSISREYPAASSYYLQAASLCPSSGNPHHQLAILASYLGDDLLAVYRYFRSLAVDIPFSKARDNLIIAFEKNRQSCSQLPGNTKITSKWTMSTCSTGRGDRGDAVLKAKDSKTEPSPTKKHDLSIREIFKAFTTRFVRLSGILFTRTSLETFEEMFSLVISDLHELLSSGPEEELNCAHDAAENGLVFVRLITILIFTVHNVNRDSEGQSYAEILQRTVLLQNAFTAAFEFAGHIFMRCIQLYDILSSYLLPTIMVFIEWLACHPYIAAGIDVEGRQSTARSFFWNQCVPFLNKLMLTGLACLDGNEDDKCFLGMSQYDDGETDSRLALWEDFELRGFLPLAPAQLILDFSRKHSFGSEGSMKNKKARIQRILAAGRALTNMACVNQQGVYFDQNLKKFVTGAKPLTHEYQMHDDLSHVPDSNILKQGNLFESAVDPRVSRSNAVKLEVMLPNIYFHAEGGEEEEEEIVFKPVTTEKPSNFYASNSRSYEIIQPTHNSESDGVAYDTQLSTPPNNIQVSTVLNATSQLHTSSLNISQWPLQHINPSTSKLLTEQETILSSGLNNLSIKENWLSTKHGSQESLNCLGPSFSPHITSPDHLNMNGMLVIEKKVSEPIIPSRFDSIVPSGATSYGPAVELSTVLPTISRKNPVSRPVRHLGPPPGFSHVPSKQLDKSSYNSVAKDQQYLQIDDYSWLDGYQSSSIKGLAMTTNHNTACVGNSNSNAFNGMTVFPFPGKQNSSVQTQGNENCQDFELFNHLKPYSEQQVQQATFQNALLPEQHQGQSLWSDHYFV